jgi:hypothetical protein
LTNRAVDVFLRDRLRLHLINYFVGSGENFLRGEFFVVNQIDVTASDRCN